MKWNVISEIWTLTPIFLTPILSEIWTLTPISDPYFIRNLDPDPYFETQKMASCLKRRPRSQAASKPISTAQPGSAWPVAGS
jgi:hypothetical protein